MVEVIITKVKVVELRRGLPEGVPHTVHRTSYGRRAIMRRPSSWVLMEWAGGRNMSVRCSTPCTIQE